MVLAGARVGDEFVSLYNRLDRRLRELANEGAETSFTGVVRRVSRDNRMIRQFRDDLIEFGELRNAIVHDRRFSKDLLADPTPDVMEKLRRIVSEFEEPTRIEQMMKTQFRVCSHDDRLTEVLGEMCSVDCSEVVVAEAERHTLLTSDGVANWLAHYAQEGIVDLESATVGDVVSYEDAD